ncbi:ribonuclease H-like YkuK family protein [Sulfoacidibacillus thermotolerans]|nr:ribonuclease H-like YkuK family protein [Sulfoacidibacillus thermotolerans]
MSPTKGNMTMDDVAADISAYIAEQSEDRYRLIVGSDSQPHLARQSTLFVTAIVVHRVGKGARFYILKRPYKRPIPLRQRIFMEASMALEIVHELEKALGPHRVALPIEVHLDVGEDGETKALIKDLIGWVTQSGYLPKIKPESFGASKVADRYSKS